MRVHVFDTFSCSQSLWKSPGFLPLSSIRFYPQPLADLSALQNKFAFVEYENDSDASKARESLNGKDLGGLAINIGK